MTRNDLHQHINTQVKPLVVAMASLEKTMQIQETIYSSHFNQQHAVNDDFNKFISTYTTNTQPASILSQQLNNPMNSMNNTNEINTMNSTITGSIPSCLSILQQQQILNLVEKEFYSLVKRGEGYGLVTDESLRQLLIKNSKEIRDEFYHSNNVSFINNC